MPKKKPPLQPPARKPRADAQRNRERILEVAKEVFTRDGGAASLDDIARQAVIGPGTLYRHFPTRDSLIEAVYRSEVERLAASEQRFAATMPPLEALRAWMLLFIEHVSSKKLIMPAMDTVTGGATRLIEGARSLIHTTFVDSVKRAITSGELRADTRVHLDQERLDAGRCGGQLGEPALELVGVGAAPEPGGSALHDLSLRLSGGEILGVAGVSGNGQRELAELILGLRRPSRGEMRLWGERANGWSVARIRDSGAASIPDDPLALALIPGLTVRQNLVLGTGPRYRRGLDFEWPRLAADMQQSPARLHFPPPSFDVRAAVLSGGNQQRVVLTRELAHGPKLIIALYPTRGLDARSAEAVRAAFRDARQAGASVLLISEDLDELFAVSDRLIVLRDGRIAGEFAPESFRPELIGPSMVGADDAA